MRIEKFDKNFASDFISAEIRNKTVFYNSEEVPIKIHGLPNGYSGKFPEGFLMSETLSVMSQCTSGGRLRFKTDSDYIILRVVLPYVFVAATMPLNCSPGCDIFVKENGVYEFSGVFQPPIDIKKIEETGGYESKISFSSKKMRDITINLPTYNKVSGIWVGIDNNSLIEAPEEYTYKEPIVFYGSSITQGGCASRPGNIYPAILSRKYDTDFINMAFSGSAQGEDNVSEYISNFKMRVFVYDYDHNAPTVEHLEKTHEKMFLKIREKNPDLPIIFASRPRVNLDDEEKKRLKIIKRTYKNALSRGDKNVYFIDGSKMFKNFGGDELCTVDGCHPNDLGFYAMSVSFDKVLNKFFKPDK